MDLKKDGDWCIIIQILLLLLNKPNHLYFKMKGVDFQVEDLIEILNVIYKKMF